MTVFCATAAFEKARPWRDKRSLVGEAATKEAGAVA
jgi:hypothetical protein